MKKALLIFLSTIWMVLIPLSVQSDTTASVYIIPVQGEIEKGLVWVIRRGIEEAEAAGASAIVLDMNTNGGAADATEEIMELLTRTDIPTYTFVDIKAFSAGSYIAVATDHIYMAPGSMIGAATPIAASPLTGAAQLDDAHAEKITSAFRAMIASTAEQNGHPVEVVEAMVDRDVEIPDLIEKGKLLTLTNNNALDVGLSEGTVDDLDELIGVIGFEEAPRETIVITPSEKLARFLTGSMVTVLLLLGGLAGLYFEIKTPGFGLPGILGIICLALFFFGHNVAGLAGYEEIILFAVGLSLLFIELFITPGFGLLGIAGILCLIVSFIAAMGKGPIFHTPTILHPNYFPGLSQFGIALAGFLLISMLTYRIVFGPSSPLYGKFVLTAEERREEGFESAEAGLSRLIGSRGPALTTLRPAGKAKFEGESVNVVSRGEFIDRGDTVEVIEVDSNRVVVKKV
ncbi:MAG: NfeD family protein [PVC group bacterium]